MGDTPVPLAAFALAEAHARDRANGIDPFAIEPTPDPDPPAQQQPQQPGFFIEPPDWPQEERERQARERQAKELEARELAATLEPVEDPPRPTAPAKRGWRKQVA